LPPGRIALALGELLPNYSTLRPQKCAPNPEPFDKQPVILQRLFLLRPGGLERGRFLQDCLGVPLSQTLRFCHLPAPALELARKALHFPHNVPKLPVLWQPCSKTRPARSGQDCLRFLG